MPKPLPPITPAAVKALLAFAPRLRDHCRDNEFPGDLRGGDRLPSGALEGAWVEYPEVVTEFFLVAGQDPWNDFNYIPEAAGRMVAEPGRIERASLEEVRTMLTWCTRGERFCDGHWAKVLGDGTVFRLLDRLEVLRAPTRGTPRGKGRIPWRGRLLGVQPRIDLGRSFDQRYHSYLGYLLLIEGVSGGEGPRSFTVRIGRAAQAEHQFAAGDLIEGMAHAVPDPEREVADLYKASALKVLERVPPASQPPPWLGPALDLKTYRERGHRRLDARTYERACRTCIYGCRMAVTMVIDQWNPGIVERRFETFCYGPKSCPSYRPGPKRKVPGRRGMSWVEEDWVDEEATSGRGPDE